MANYVLSRPGEVQIGAYGAAKDASANTTLGSCRSVELVWEADKQTATSTSANDAVVAVYYSAGGATLTIVAEEITAANVQKAFDASLNTSGTQVNVSSSGGVPDYYAVWVEGFYLGGTAAQLYCRKASIQPSGGLSLNNEQQLLTITMDVLYDPDASGVPYMLSLGPVT